MFFVVIWAACAAGGYAIGKAKARATEGLLLGLLLGVIGLIIIACLKPKQPALATSFAPVTPGYAMPAPLPPGAPPAVAAAWLPDPSGRHQHRWWDGVAWTEHVADNGVTSVDVPQAPPVPSPMPIAPSTGW